LIGTVSVAAKHEIVMAIIGGLFVMSRRLSVIIQVGYFKMTGRRVFLMAPIHHHYEKNGLDGEPDRHPVLDHRGGPALIGLSTLKLR
jgi:phospho-N-acetylmuramoyl-pentapeptide-transferase